MKLAHYFRNGQTRVGIVQGASIFDLCDSAKELGLSLEANLSIDRILSADLLGSIQNAEGKITSGKMYAPVGSVKLMSPVLSPEKILLVAVNYKSHSVESRIKQLKEPYFFAKFRNTLIGPEDPIVIPRISSDVDWEVELAAIIGKAGKSISRRNAFDYVAGYAVSNDVSFRDLQNSTLSPKGPLGMNWVKGKGLDSSFPLGPWLVTKDQVSDPHKLSISLSVNGRRKQNSDTGQMLFKIDQLIEYVSADMTLRPGDIISTGTPEGVAAHTGEPFLKDGDLVEATISEIGTLRNPVKSE
jgi:2-keto-4-pentenoate hydratase/2-oxohepta-3-ene-1,7-dioic acid hydratase in catechol pathway